MPVVQRFLLWTCEKFKAQFCTRCNGQVEGIDLFELCESVVQWTTVCQKLGLEVPVGLKFNQGDMAVAVLHADLDDGENVFVKMPHGFKQNGNVLKLKKKNYGLNSLLEPAKNI